MIQHRNWEQYDVEASRKRERNERWSAQGKAIVQHPAYGAVIVPAASKFAAICCAAEVWGCDWMDIRDAKSVAAKGNAPIGPVQKGEVHDFEW